VFHVHVIPVAQLDTATLHCAAVRRLHVGRFTIRETAHPYGCGDEFPFSLSIALLYVDACPVFAGKSQQASVYLNALLRLFDGFFQLHGSSSTMARAFS
jgi:hypothetical protein